MASGFWVQASGFRLNFRVMASGFRVNFRLQASRVYGSGFRERHQGVRTDGLWVEDSEFRVQGLV